MSRDRATGQADPGCHRLRIGCRCHHRPRVVPNRSDCGTAASAQNRQVNLGRNRGSPRRRLWDGILLAGPRRREAPPTGTLRDCSLPSRTTGVPATSAPTVSRTRYIPRKPLPLGMPHWFTAVSIRQTPPCEYRHRRRVRLPTSRASLSPSRADQPRSTSVQTSSAADSPSRHR